MKIQDIAERATQKPFRPFALETTGGSWIDVWTEADIFLNPRRADMVVVFDATGRIWLLGIDQISALKSK